MLAQRHRLLAAALALQVACRPPAGVKAPACDRPLAADVVVDAAATANPGHNGEAWPTHVRIYQLSGAPALEMIDPATVAEDEKAAFGALIVERQERVIYPDSHDRWPIAVADGATHLVLVALFHRAESDGWAAVIELPRDRQGLCASPPPAALCVFATVDRSALAAGSLPPAGFVGDGAPCTPLAILEGPAAAPADGSTRANAPTLADAPSSPPSAPKAPGAPKSPIPPR